MMKSRQYFSLLEITIVLILISLLLTLLIGRTTQRRETIIIENLSLLKNAFATASLNAQLTNQPVELILQKSGDNVKIDIIYSKGFTQEINAIWSGQKYYELKNSKIIKIANYKFFPTGEGSGKSVRIIIFDETYTLTIDSLTGRLSLDNLQ